MQTQGETRNKDLNQYFTPAPVTWTLLDELRSCYDPFPTGTIVEPCAGTGSIADVLSDPSCRRNIEPLAQRVVTNDVDPSLDVEHDSHVDIIESNLPVELSPWTHTFNVCDWVVTNPPYTTDTYKASDFVKRALDMAGQGVAMLLRDSFLEACRDRSDLLHDGGEYRSPDHIIHLYPRISFTGDGKTDSSHYVWCVWTFRKYGNAGETTTVWRDWDDGDAHELQHPVWECYNRHTSVCHYVRARSRDRALQMIDTETMSDRGDVHLHEVSYDTWVFDLDHDHEVARFVQAYPYYEGVIGMGPTIYF